jgi:hypothetical protein
MCNSPKHTTSARQTSASDRRCALPDSARSMQRPGRASPRRGSSRSPPHQLRSRPRRSFVCRRCAFSGAFLWRADAFSLGRGLAPGNLTSRIGWALQCAQKRKRAWRFAYQGHDGAGLSSCPDAAVWIAVGLSGTRHQLAKLSRGLDAQPVGHQRRELMRVLQGVLI